MKKIFQLTTLLVLLLTACTFKQEDRIVFFSNCMSEKLKKYVALLVDGQVTRFDPFSEEGILSPDGKRLIFAEKLDKDRYRYYVKNADGSDVSLIMEDTLVEDSLYGYDLLYESYAHHWSPNGKAIAYIYDTLHQYGGFEDIYLFDLETGVKKQLTNNERVSRFDWSPDGSHIVYASDKENIERLYTLEIETGKGINISENLPIRFFDTPVWSPNGKWIAFVSYDDTGNNPDLYMTRPDGTELTRLTDFSGYDEYPSWSPDSTKLVFQSNRVNPYQWGLSILNIKDKSVEPLTVPGCEGDIEYPVWLP